MAYSTQRGRFTKVSGTLDYDEAAPEKSKISASIAAASLTTGEALVDNELKGAAFFNVVARPSSPSRASPSDRARQRRQTFRARSPSTASPSP